MHKGELSPPHLGSWASAKSLWQRRGERGPLRDEAAPGHRKRHLYVLVHGFNSRADHLQVMPRRTDTARAP